MKHLPIKLSMLFPLVVLSALMFVPAGCSDDSGNDINAIDMQTDTNADGADAAGDVESDGDAQSDSESDGEDIGDVQSDSDVPPIPGLDSLVVAPMDPVLTVVAGGMSQTQQFTATGTFSDGSSRDITDEVTWAHTNTLVGQLDPASGLFTTSNQAAGLSRVSARAGDVEGHTTLQVVMEGNISDPGAMDLPVDVADLFDPSMNTVDTMPGPNRPAIVYPSHETKFPRNIFMILFQWETGQDNDLFRLSFDSQTTHLAVYTDQDRWEADQTTWQWLANSNAGQPVEVQLQAVDSMNPGTVYASSTITIYFSSADVLGAIYYWSTGTEAVMKGLPDQPDPTVFFPTNGECGACHTVSRNGEKLALGYGGENLLGVDVTNQTALGYTETPGADPLEDKLRWKVGWSTFSPDAEMIVFSDGGQLRLIDANTGDPIGPNEGLIDIGDLNGNHPDWAPSGEYVVFAAGTDDKTKEVKAGSLYRVAYNGGNWGQPELLLESQGDDDNNFFPMYSPDSSMIVYGHGQGGSKDAPTAEIRIISADGSQGPVTLQRMNQRVMQLDGVENIGNSMPTWAPTTVPGVQWLAFSSLRAYGKVAPDGGRDQIWIAALDPGQVFGATDASYSAFWAPFQDLDVSNHRAFWAIDTDQECPSTEEVCDGLDNNCNGVVDEGCLKVELCGADGLGDGVDNDEDGEVDEGCGGLELCGDGVDNDGDGLVDEDCCAPSEQACFDGADNDCDDLIDEDDPDCQSCVPSEDIDCTDGVDNDCDDLVDCADDDCLTDPACIN